MTALLTRCNGRKLPPTTIFAKYNIEYAIPLQGRDHPHEQTQHHLTDDPVICEAFLSELLERGITIRSVSHEGVALAQNKFDRMIKTAAGMMATATSAAHLAWIVSKRIIASVRLLKLRIARLESRLAAVRLKDMSALVAGGSRF